MPRGTNVELAPSHDEVENFATLDLPERFDDLEKDLPDETKAVVDFNDLLKKRQAIKKRLETVMHIDPNWEYEGDDSKLAVYKISTWFGHEVVWAERKDLNEEIVKKEAEHIQERFNELLERIKERIQKECGNLGSLNVMSEVAGLLATPEENVKRKRTIEALTFQPDNSAASYSPNQGKIFVNNEYTRLDLDAKDLVEALVEEGFVSGYESVHHEQIHSKQFPPPSERAKIVKDITTKALHVVILGLAIKKFGVFETASVYIAINKMMPLIALALIGMRNRTESFKSKIIAAETQAYYGSGRFAGDKDIYTKRGIEHRRMLSSLTEFMEHMSKYEVMRKKGDVDKLIMAYDQIRRLYALGLDDTAVAGTVKGAKWRKKELQYDKLGAKIEELMQVKGLSADDVENLVEAEDIKSVIYFENVRAIAREELRKVYVEQRELEKARYELRISAERENNIS